jgi:cytosine/adenosine deaminase-related metal-dependent hydrolase
LVVGFDVSTGDHVVYRDGEVVYENDRVVFVGHGYPDAVDRTIEAGDAFIGPGFIDLDALGDIDQALLDTYQPAELSLGLQWSEEYFRARRHDVFTPTQEAFKRRYALVQLLLNGVTTAMPIAAETYKGWAESTDELTQVADIAAELGLRLYLGPSYRSGVVVVRADGTPTVAWDEQLGEDGLRDAVAFARRLDGAHQGLIRTALLPCRIETVTFELLRATRRAADELGCPVRLHAAQSLLEVRFLRELYGQRPIPLLAELGFLGPLTSIPHVFYVRGQRDIGESGPDDLAMLAEHQTTVIHCPLTAIHHAHGLETFDRYRAAGVNLAIGTDTFPPDMIRVLDYGVNVAKLMTRDQSAGQAADLYRAATLGGARALGRDDLGRLAPGARADIVVVDLSSIRSGPLDDPIRTLFMNTGGAYVRTVIVDGRTVVQEGCIDGLDTAPLRSEAQRYFDQLKLSYCERDYLRRPPEVLFPASFPILERTAP